LTLITFPPELNLRMATEKCKMAVREVINLLQRSLSFHSQNQLN